MLLTLIRWLWFLNPYLLYLFAAMLFITSGKKDQDDDFALPYDIDL